MQQWEEQTVGCIQQNWARVRELSAEWRGACRHLTLHKERAVTARQNWLKLADGKIKAHKQLRREIAELELLHREMQKDKPKTLKQERREIQAAKARKGPHCKERGSNGADKAGAGSWKLRHGQ